MKINITRKIKIKHYEDKIEDLSYIQNVLEKNKEYSVNNRNEIRNYGIKTFGLSNILEFEYVPKLQSLL